MLAGLTWRNFNLNTTTAATPAVCPTIPTSIVLISVTSLSVASRCGRPIRVREAWSANTAAKCTAAGYGARGIAIRTFRLQMTEVATRVTTATTPTF